MAQNAKAKIWHQAEGLDTKLMGSVIGNRDLSIGDARLATDECRLH